MPETFQDGFPTNPAEAIEFSYFFTEAEKQEWREWLQTSTLDEQNEMVEMLHKIWLDKQKQVVPDQFNGNMQFATGNNQVSNNGINQPNIPNFAPQTDLYAQTQNLNQSFNTPNQNNGFPAQAFDFQNTEPEHESNQNFNNLNPFPQANSNPASAPFEFENETIANPNPSFIPNNDSLSTNLANNQKSEVSESNQPNSQALNDFDDDDFDFSFDDIEDEPKPALAPSEQAQPEIAAKEVIANDDDDIFKDFDLEDKNQDVATQTANQTPTKPESKQTTAPAFSISKIRETSTKEELENLYTDYLNARQSTSSSKIQHDESYDKLMEKVITIVLNFESVADYLEFMTSKLAEMNDTIIKQAEKIATFQNGQNNYAHDLKNEIEQLKNKVGGIEKRIENDFAQYKTQLDSIEIKSESQNDSAYTSHDSLNMQIDLLKSKIIKLEKANQQGNQGITTIGTGNRPHPPLSTTKSSENHTTENKNLE